VIELLAIEKDAPKTIIYCVIRYYVYVSDVKRNVSRGPSSHQHVP